MEFEVGPAGDLGLRLAFAASPQPALTHQLLSIQTAARETFADSLIDSLVGYSTLTLFYRPLTLERDRATDWLISQAEAVQNLDTANTPGGKTITLPVLYHPRVAPDLEWIADSKSLTTQAVIDLHCGAEYFAYATGFAPGFCYLGDIAKALAVPRLDTPRQRVPTGAVAIADRQTAVYPCESPGGWRLIGACPVALFDLTATPASTLSIGDTIRFEPISEAKYRSLGGTF
jgi:KipI family sensor histidine kinase inhibitor